MSEPYSPSHQKGDVTIPLPKQIGRYIIDGLYAQGGMSVLFLATDPLTHNHVLIKVLLPHFLSDKAVVEQFENEGRIISLSDHPNIVKLYEYGSWEGGLFIAMELVQGTSLRKMLQHTPLPLKKALEVLIQICYAVSHLHSQGISHVDLKPENILITDQGQVKLIDFGIAKILSEVTSGIRRFAGTPIYMSPESQQNPTCLSLQSDIYSLGIIAYELVMGKITHGRIILTLAPKGMQPILAKALQPQLKDRYQDINDFLHDLSEYIHSGAYQKDKHGSDYFFELFDQLESSQKTLLSSLIPKETPQVGIATSYGVGLNALYFRYYSAKEKTLLLIAEGEEKGVHGVIETFRLHTLFECMKENFSDENFIESLSNETKKQNLSFHYSSLLLDHSQNSFQWISPEKGILFHIEKNLLSKINESFLQKSFSPQDRFVVISGTTPSLLEFSSNPITPLSIVLKEVIKSTSTFSPKNQTFSILQKLQLRYGCIIEDNPICIMAIDV